MIIEIKPIDREKWHGYKKENDFSRPIKIFPTVDPDTRKYNTGLDEKDIAKLKEMGFERDFSNEWKRYSNHPFWDSTEVKVKLPKHTLRLNTDFPLDFVKYKYILEHPIVANSRADYEEGKYPNATHYIVNSPAVMKKKASLVEAKKKAYALLEEADRDKKVRMLMILTGRDLFKKPDNVIEVEIDNALQANPKAVLKLLSQDEGLLEAKYLVKKAIKKGVLRQNAINIKYMDLSIGGSIDDAALFLTQQENQDLRDKIEEQVTV